MTLISEKTNTLLSRVKTGNEKIWDAYNWALVIDVEKERDKWDQAMDKIERAVARLNLLCLELEASGYERCIYDKPTCSLTKPWAFCWACPSKTEHWRSEC